MQLLGCYTMVEEFEAEAMAFRAVTISYASLSVLGWFFICRSFLRKNMHQMKTFNIILLVILVLSVIHIGAIKCFQPQKHVLNLFIYHSDWLKSHVQHSDHKMSKSEFSRYHFRKTEVAPFMRCKSGL